MNKTETIIIRVEPGTEKALRRAANNAEREYTDFMRRLYKKVIQEDLINNPITKEDGRIS